MMQIAFWCLFSVAGLCLAPVLFGVANHTRLFILKPLGKTMLKKIGGFVVSVAPLSAFAAVPAAVSTAISDAGTDAVTVASAVLVAVVALLAFRFMRKEAH